MAPVSKWTVAREQQLAELWDEKSLTASDIAERMGGFNHHKDGGRNAILGKAHRMNLPARRESISPEEAKRRLERRREIDAARRRYRHENARYAQLAFGKPVREPRIKPEKPREVPMFAGSLNIAFADLRDFSEVSSNECRFPVGEFFCGVETPIGQSWCPHHRKIVFGYEPRISEADRERRRRQAIKRSSSYFVPTAIRCSDADDGLGASS